jgi:hypothetical protein
MCSECARELDAAQAAWAADEIAGYKIGDRVYHPADVVIIRRRDRDAQQEPGQG